MRQIILFFIVLAILASFSCAMSPVRKVLPKDNLTLDISLGGAIVDNIQGVDFLPLPANLSVGVSYGIIDKATVGMNFYPVALFDGTLVLEPFGVYNFVQQENSIPNVNGALVIPVALSFKNGELKFYPAISVAPTYEDDTGIVYTALELQVDSTEWNASLGWKLGGEWKVWEMASIGGEIGLLYIGKESIVSPLSRVGIGVPVFIVGSSINIGTE